MNTGAWWRADPDEDSEERRASLSSGCREARKDDIPVDCVHMDRDERDGRRSGGSSDARGNGQVPMQKAEGAGQDGTAAYCGLKKRTGVWH